MCDQSIRWCAQRKEKHVQKTHTSAGKELKEMSGEKPTTKIYLHNRFEHSYGSYHLLKFISLYLVLTPQGENQQILWFENDGASKRTSTEKKDIEE